MADDILIQQVEALVAAPWCAPTPRLGITNKNRDMKLLLYCHIYHNFNYYLLL